ncbi:hypothetical protein OG533_38910 [Streptomyces sp. NBC_01186]|uniref:hypothetical protein n=1 Tax=Streptomyces sp. NBC_01186 TaxID=2903765 RepID=UPI002E12B5BE|nr:hypothetical protein OG533_38910 [Streptomyces sp. NBC_01186]
MSLLYGASAASTEVFLTRLRGWVLGWVPGAWALVWFLTVEEGWHLSFLPLCVLPPAAAYLGVRAHREIRAGLAWTAGALALASLGLSGAIELLSRAF